MSHSTCTIDGCDTNVYAKGLCRLDYRRSRPRTPDKRETIACDCCGADYQRPKRNKARWGANYCSYLCRDYTRWGPLSSELPANHWARHYGTTCDWTWAPPPEKPLPPFRCGTCGDCGKAFVERAYSTPSKWCSERCSRRVAARIRKAREHNSPGHYRYTDIMRQYRKQGLVCAYCRKPCDGLPDPEHVIPISRGGRNDMSNLVAACRPCNADKRDLLLTEWAEDRARRGLTTVITDLAGKQYAHLALA